MFSYIHVTFNLRQPPLCLVIEDRSCIMKYIPRFLFSLIKKIPYFYSVLCNFLSTRIITNIECRPGSLCSLLLQQWRLSIFTSLMETLGRHSRGFVWRLLAWGPVHSLRWSNINFMSEMTFSLSNSTLFLLFLKRWSTVWAIFKGGTKDHCQWPHASS